MKRLGVFVCHCGLNIAGTVNVKEITDARPVRFLMSWLRLITATYARNQDKL